MRRRETLGADTMGSYFDYSGAPVPIRDDLAEAHERAWEGLRAPGNWWTGAERIDIAAETRNALDCAYCRERQQALSPTAIDGTHDRIATHLSLAAVDLVHRIVTDASRLSDAFRRELESDGISEGHYVELLGVVVATFSIDEVHRALGLPLAPLPSALAGQPSRVRPTGAAPGPGWVSILSLEAARAGENADLYAGLPVAPNVISALSLVPDAVRRLKELSKAHYVPMLQVMDPSADGRALTRPQIELVAGRVSALNECFY